MNKHNAHSAAIQALLPDLGSQMADAARYLIAHPQDVALYSMRELARRARVAPVTLVRLAQRVGLPGYGGLRKHYIDALLNSRGQAVPGAAHDPLTPAPNVDSARAIVATSRQVGSAVGFAQLFFRAEQELLQAAVTSLSNASLDAATDLLAAAPRVFVLGRRTAYPPAFALAYALRKARPSVLLLDDVAGALESHLDDACPGDVLVIITFTPFGKLSTRLAQRAEASGVRIIAITDSLAAPARSLAGELCFLAPTQGSAFPDSAGAALAVANLLAALTISKLGEAAQQRIRRNEQHIMQSGEYVQTRRRASGARTAKHQAR